MAAAQLKNGVATADPASTHNQLHWAVVLWRGVRGHDKRATQRALRAYPRLSQYFDAGTLSLNPSFAGFITDLANTDIKDQLAAIEKDPLRAEWTS